MLSFTNRALEEESGLGGGGGGGGTHPLTPRLNNHPSLIKMIAVAHLHNIMLILQ